jgi:uncharacterized protein YjbJ (UPF0337 family)
MGDQLDQATGRTKEALGVLTDDQELEREGKAERLGGEVKEKLGDLADKGRDLVDDVTDAFTKRSESDDAARP